MMRSMDPPTTFDSPDDQLCQRCGRPLTPDELSAGLCEACAEDDRNNDFADVEMSLWQEGPEQEGEQEAEQDDF
jgi:hypothetical protein